MGDVIATQIVILGGTGDLSQRKLLPALFDLYTRDMLPLNFHIIGLARSEKSDIEYQEFVKDSLIKNAIPKEGFHKPLADFCQRISYVSGAFTDDKTYQKLADKLEEFDKKENLDSNKLFYLAVPPTFYDQIFTDLKKSGLADEKPRTWTHILVEKPFGNNLKTAQKLDAKLASLYREDQIFRIDHYLAKEAVQNILSFRFANRILMDSWNNQSIESVHITMTETIDVGERTNFYEGLGALRDVGQNHLLQLLALTAMREPKEFTVEEIRQARQETLEALKPIDIEHLEKYVLRAQYEGYKDKDPALKDSETETYFELKAELDSPNWQGVPFYIRAGKALNKSEVSIVVKFKDVTAGMFKTESCHTAGNEVRLTISPEQTMAIVLNAKAPGLGFQIEQRTLGFVCAKGDLEIKNSYEKVLYDAIIGDQTLFTKTEEVLASWKYITPIIENWGKLPLYTYQKGSEGPKETIIPK